MALMELLVKLKLTGAKEAADGVKGVKKEVTDTGDAAQKASPKVEGLSDRFKHMEAGAQAAAVKLRYVTSEAHSAIGVIGRVTGGIATVTSILGGVAGNAAVKAASDFIDLNARLEAVTGSAEKAAIKLDFAQKVANPSNFTFRQLADATTTLEAFGVNAERALPTVARLGMVFGAGNEQIGELTRALGGLATGKFPEMDVTARFGLNKKQFETKGIKFSGSGELLSSATDTFDALEKIVNEKYGGIFAKMANTPSAKLASLQDSFEKLERVVGGGIMTIAGPAIEHLTQVINALGSSGVALDVVTDAVAGLQKMMGSYGESDGLTMFAADALSVIAELPDAAAKFGHYLAGVWDVTTDNVSSLFNTLMAESKTLASTILNAVIDGTNSLMYRLVDTLDTGLSKITHTGKLGLADDLPTIARVAVPDVSKYMANIKPLREIPDMEPFDITGRSNEFYNRLTSAMAKPVDNSVPSARGNWLNAATEPSTTGSVLEKIERNTGKSADLLSLRASATGPGAAGIIGATAAELGGGPMSVGSYRSPRIVVEVGGAQNDLTRFIEKIVQQVVSKGQGVGGFNPRSL